MPMTWDQKFFPTFSDCDVGISTTFLETIKEHDDVSRAKVAKHGRTNERTKERKARSRLRDRKDLRRTSLLFFVRIVGRNLRGTFVRSRRFLGL